MLFLSKILELRLVMKPRWITHDPATGVVVHPGHTIEFDNGRYETENEEEIEFKLCRIENKTVVNGGQIQLNLHDGRNILVRLNDPTNAEEDIYKTKDVLKIAIPSQEILERIEFQEDIFSIVMVRKRNR